MWCWYFFFSSRRRHTRCALVTGVQTCALPIFQTKDAKYIASSDRQFSVTVDDATYARLLDRVRAWQDAPQPSYDLGTRNCIHFVMELAEIVGLKVNHDSDYFKKPKSFLLEVKDLNPQLQ